MLREGESPRSRLRPVFRYHDCVPHDLNIEVATGVLLITKPKPWVAGTFNQSLMCILFALFQSGFVLIRLSTSCGEVGLPSTRRIDSSASRTAVSATGDGDVCMLSTEYSMRPAAQRGGPRPPPLARVLHAPQASVSRRLLYSAGRHLPASSIILDHTDRRFGARRRMRPPPGITLRIWG